jgi:hypothetical protein
MAGAIISNITLSKPAGTLAARLATGAIVVGLCVFAVSRGLVILGFAIATQETSEGRASQIDGWFNTPLVATMALDQALDTAADANGVATAQRRDDFLSELLSHRPLSPMAWLSLAAERQADGASQRDVLAALKMSALTGPNEAPVMWRRGMFSLQQWETLDPDFQRQTVRDLAGTIGQQLLDDSNVEQIRGVLSRKSTETRAQITSLLQAERLDAKDLAEIGLDTAKAAP